MCKIKSVMYVSIRKVLHNISLGKMLFSSVSSIRKKYATLRNNAKGLHILSVTDLSIV